MDLHIALLYMDAPTQVLPWSVISIHFHKTYFSVLNFEIKHTFNAWGHLHGLREAFHPNKCYDGSLVKTFMILPKYTLDSFAEVLTSIKIYYQIIILFLKCEIHELTC